MLIGIISDTHDDMAAIRRAVHLLNELGVSHALHAGDITSPFTFEVFYELRCAFTGIFGNNDGDRVLLREKSGGNLYPQPYRTNLGEERIVLIHEPDLVDALADSGHFSLVIYGHTHKPEIRRVRETVIVNPGKVATLHKGGSTLAIFNTATRNAEIIPLR